MMRFGRANARYDLKGLKRPQTTSNDPKCAIDMKRSETVQFMSDPMRMDLTFFSDPDGDLDNVRSKSFA